MKNTYFYYVLLLLMSGHLSAQTLEDFEDETLGAATFTNNGQSFNIISAGGNTYDIYNSGGSLFGWNGTAKDSRFIDNTSSVANNINLTIATSGGSAFTLKSFYLYIAQASGGILGLTGEVTVSGSLGGVQQFTATINSGYNTNYNFQNGFTFINMSTFGGANNSNVVIDRYTITSTGNIRYISLDAMRWQAAAIATVNASVTTLNAFASCQGVASAAQSFSVSGASLSGNLTVTAPTGFEVSQSEGSGYASSFNLSPSSGTVNATTVYARVSSSASDSPSGNITVSSTGAASKNVAVSGTVTNVTIGTQPSNATACAGGNTSFTVAATGATGYQWQVNQGSGFTNIANNAVYSGATTATLNISGATAGYNGYAYRAIASNGSCTATSGSATLTVISLSASTSQTNTICSGNATGSATVTPSGGITPYTYSWAPSGGNAATANGLTAGTYTVTVSDASGCSIERVVTITAASDCSLTTTWNGSSWSNGTPTCYAYSVQIMGNYNSAVHGDITACSLTIFSGTINVASGDNLIIKGSVINAGGTLVFENNANLVQADNATNFGQITFKKNSSALYNEDYTIWSSPVNGPQTLKNFSPQTLDERFYVYNTPLGAFSNYQSASGIFGGTPDQETFDVAKGYLIRMPEGWSTQTPAPYQGSFIGTPNNGNISIGLNVQGGRFNVVGNPYPSPVNIKDLITSNLGQLDNGTLYFWRKRNGTTGTTYATVTLAAYVAATAEGGDTSAGQFQDGNEAQWVINPGQGFFVKASATATALSFTNTMRRAVNNGQFFKVSDSMTADPSPQVPTSKWWLDITNSSNDFGQTATAYTDMTTLGLDYGWDGRLVNDGQLAVYTLAENTKLAIQARPSFDNSDMVPLGYKTTTGGTLTITLSQATGVFNDGQLVYLMDSLTGTTQNLSNAGYTFTSDAGTFDNRFTVVYSSTLDVAVPAFDNQAIFVYKNNNILTINSGHWVMAHIELFDLTGRLVYNTDRINASEVVISDLKVSDQVLIVKVTSKEGVTIHKKIIFQN